MSDVVIVILVVVVVVDVVGGVRFIVDNSSGVVTIGFCSMFLILVGFVSNQKTVSKQRTPGACFKTLR